MSSSSTYSFSEADAEVLVGAASSLLDLYPERAQSELGSLRTEIDALSASGKPEDVADDLFAKVLAGRDAAARAGTLPETATGSVRQLSVSDGGVPKTAVDTVEVGFRGLVGDRQRNRRFHGHAHQALCLWSEEVITDLQGNGHPIAMGSAGENITVGGLEWAGLTMGTRIQIGTVLAQLSSFAVPCSHQAQWFTDRDFSRLHHEKGEISRLYAAVIEPGTISVGDAVIVEP